MSVLQIIPATKKRKEQIRVYANPSDVLEVKYDLWKPKWIPLVVGGEWNPKLRNAMKGMSGAYMWRYIDDPAVRYCGESHSGRLWKTFLRHHHAQHSFRYRTEKYKNRASAVEWDPERCEVAYFITKAKEARNVEGELIAMYSPILNQEQAELRGQKVSTEFDVEEFEEEAA